MIRVNVSATDEQANGVSYNMAISEDGAWVGFASEATTSCPGKTRTDCR